MRFLLCSRPSRCGKIKGGKKIYFPTQFSMFFSAFFYEMTKKNFFLTLLGEVVRETWCKKRGGCNREDKKFQGVF